MTFHFSVELTTAPMQPAPPDFPEDGATGSVIDFYGVVRDQEKGTAIAGLDYETYGEMARHQFEQIARDVQEKYLVRSARVVHRVGVVPIGQPSIHLRVRSAHRGEGFAFAAELLTRMKADVPIWKKPQPLRDLSEAALPEKEF